MARRLDGALALLLLALGGWQAAQTWPLTVDDSYIVARYAENAVHHGQLAFNLGEPAVEGVTSPALLAVAWLAVLLGASPLVAMKLFGVLGLLFAAFFALLFVEELELAAPARTFAAAYFLSPEVATFAFAGLETAAFVAAGLATLWALQRACREPGQGWILGAVGGLAFVIRPEGAVLGGLALGVWAVAQLRDRPPSWRRDLPRAIAAFAVPVLAVIAWRWATFGALVPNTYHAKMGARFDPTFLHGMATSIGVELWDLVVVATGLVVVAVSLGWRPRDPRRGPVLVGLVALLTTGIVAVAYARHELVMNYAHRFQHHLLPLLWLAAAPLVAAAARAVVALAPRRRAAVLWAGLLLGLAVVAGVLRRAPIAEAEAAYRAHYQRVIGTMSTAAAAWVQAEIPPDALIACYPDAGLVPYVTGRRTLDFGKLNDARLARGEQSDIEVLVERAPEAVILWQRAYGRLWSEEADALVAHPRFAAHYREVALFGDVSSGMGYVVYRRAP